MNLAMCVGGADAQGCFRWRVLKLRDCCRSSQRDGRKYGAGAAITDFERVRPRKGSQIRYAFRLWLVSPIKLCLAMANIVSGPPNRVGDIFEPAGESPVRQALKLVFRSV